MILFRASWLYGQEQGCGCILFLPLCLIKAWKLPIITDNISAPFTEVLNKSGRNGKDCYSLKAVFNKDTALYIGLPALLGFSHAHGALSAPLVASIDVEDSTQTIKGRN